MARPKFHTEESIIEWAKSFKHKFGFFPVRDDLKGRTRAAYEDIHNFPMMHATTIERIFGSWSDFREACGEAVSRFTHSDVAEQASVQYMIEKYDFIPSVAEQDVVDGYIGSRAIELKASIRRRKTGNSTRFRWVLHNRDYSKLVDEMFLIGTDEDGNVLLEIHLPTKEDIQYIVDNKQAIELPGEALISGYTKSVLWTYVVGYVPLSE